MILSRAAIFADSRFNARVVVLEHGTYRKANSSNAIRSSNDINSPSPRSERFGCRSATMSLPFMSFCVDDLVNSFERLDDAHVNSEPLQIRWGESNDILVLHCTAGCYCRSTSTPTHCKDSNFFEAGGSLVVSWLRSIQYRVVHAGVCFEVPVRTASVGMNLHAPG